MPFVEPEPPPDLRRDSKFSACREWRPFGGAFAASVLLHALALVGLATILASPSLGDPRGPPQAPIALLQSAPTAMVPERDNDVRRE